MNQKYIIYTGSFNIKIGGIIALHRLCDLLNQNNEKAFLWNWDKPIFSRKRPIEFIIKYLKYFRRNLRHPFQFMPNFNTPMARFNDIKNSIVIYPETIDGNPLNADYVVRWFLHKPGYHTGKILYGHNELYFFYQTVFNNTEINPHKDHLLQTIFILDDIYKQTNFGSRKGTCYILRKGKGRTIVHDLNDSILVDELSHEEMAKIFNQVEMCISYDTYTMYSQFAALCGAISVIIPEENVSKTEWYPDEKIYYGLAYGFDNIPYALATRSLLLPTLKEQEKKANQTVHNFIQKCNEYFI
ncbi:MAG: hypothetical protein PHI47_04090 [Sulfuricurvum sp.]|uniref:hypothetical protein n=1 Tax=Sulfuricurvum sp. TaxID=2025608 RepID=UPI00261BF9B7|nr:hypothetical protein [Sulfuricurvum sp.]MDD5159206.1 hypothetical protein [Sulfuricurvum sp.]